MSLSSIQINRALKSASSTKLYYRGCFASNSIPIVSVFPACLVINTDPSHKPGQHWVCVYLISPSHCEYFDSYGIAPYVSDIKLWLRQFNNVTVSYKQVQSELSSVCGQHCIFFLTQRCLNKSMREITSLFENTILFDRFVARFVSKLINSTDHMFDDCPVTNVQSCVCKHLINHSSGRI